MLLTRVLVNHTTFNQLLVRWVLINHLIATQKPRNLKHIQDRAAKKSTQPHNTRWRYERQCSYSQHDGAFCCVHPRSSHGPSNSNARVHWDCTSSNPISPLSRTTPAGDSSSVWVAPQYRTGSERQLTGQFPAMYPGLLLHSPFSAQNAHESLLSTQLSCSVLDPASRLNTCGMGWK